MSSSYTCSKSKTCRLQTLFEIFGKSLQPAFLYIEPVLKTAKSIKNLMKAWSFRIFPAMRQFGGSFRDVMAVAPWMRQQQPPQLSHLLCEGSKAAWTSHRIQKGVQE